MNAAYFRIIALGLLFAFSLPAQDPDPKLDPKQDEGRILFVPRNYRSAGNDAFLVFERKVGNRIECHRYGSREKVTIDPARTRKMIYIEDTPPFYVTQHALSAIIEGQEKAPVVELAAVVGDTSGRMDTLKRSELARSQMLRVLNEEHRRKSSGDLDVETYEENVRQMLEESVMFEMAKKAAGTHDFMLAAALAQQYFHTIKQNFTKLFPTAEGRHAGENVLLQQQEELVNLYREHFKAGEPRRARFRALCPQARGVWSETPPVDYAGFLRTARRSMTSFLKLDDLSSTLDFQDWGIHMLNILLMIENSPVGRELESEFDRTITEREPSGTTPP